MKPLRALAIRIVMDWPWNLGFLGPLIFNFGMGQKGKRVG